MTMTPLDCRGCGRVVRVEKFSAAHTSIEWTFDSRECPFIAALADADVFGSHSRRCEQLRRTIDEAVADHELTESVLELPTAEQLPRLH
ncbi:hypothetical protein CA982_01985 [Gordonia lacunae]|uniref:Ferredoxin n=2 Tax=Gordonia lacunae TaxID=417102 RepID=A0A243QFI8_9ACTN|nr:hypothetical protein CA982_01985 [Gordonia lacunae]